MSAIPEPARRAERAPEGEPQAPKSGFTLVELMVAMFITVILGTIVVMAYNTSMQSYYRTEKQLQALAAFRNTTDRLEREVNSMVFKSSVYAHPVVAGKDGSGWHRVIFWTTGIKYLHGDAWLNSDPYPWTECTDDGSYKPSGVHNPAPALGAADWWKVDPGGRSLFKINFRPRYMGYYSTLDGFTIDRTEWYYNPPEERRVWSDGKDNDYDDPYGDAGLRILYDDRGCLMFRKRFDKHMRWAEWDAPAGRPNHYRDSYHGPYSRADFPPQADERQGPLVNWDADGDGDTDNDDRIDTGTVIGEGFADLRFYYLYKLRTSDRFIYADWWPWDDDNDPTNANGLDANMPKKTIIPRVGGTYEKSGNDLINKAATVQPAQDFDIAYFTLPMAISVKFTFVVGRQRHVYEKLIYLHASRWLKYLNP